MEKEFSSSKYTLGQMNAIIKKMHLQAGEDAPERFLRDELLLQEKQVPYKIEHGHIIFTVASKNISYHKMMERIKKRNIEINKWRVDEFVGSIYKKTNLETTKIALIKCRDFPKYERFTFQLQKVIKFWKYDFLDIEPFLLLTEMLQDENFIKLNLSRIILSSPHKSNSCLFTGYLGDDNIGYRRYLDVIHDSDYSPWDDKAAFAFVVKE